MVEWRYEGEISSLTEVAMVRQRSCRESLRSVTTSSYIPFAVSTRADGLITSEEGSFDFFVESSGPRHKKTSKTGQQGNRRPGDEDLRPRMDLYRAGNTGKSEIFVDGKGAETHQSARVRGWIIPAGSDASFVIGCACPPSFRFLQVSAATSGRASWAHGPPEDCKARGSFRRTATSVSSFCAINKIARQQQTDQPIMGMTLYWITDVRP
jgi:hypothetical protein